MSTRETRLALLQQAYEDIATGQVSEFRVGTKTYTMLDLESLGREIDRLEGQIARAGNMVFRPLRDGTGI